MNTTRTTKNLFSSYQEAQYELANKKHKTGTSWRIRQNENSWFYLEKITVSQDLNGDLKVNGKRVGELINGLFREGCDDLSFWSESSKHRFLGRMMEHDKELEARAIISAAS